MGSEPSEADKSLAEGKVDTETPLSPKATGEERREALKKLALGAIGLLAGEAGANPSQAQPPPTGPAGRVPLTPGSPVVRTPGTPLATNAAKNFVVSRNVSDLRQVRLPGVSKPLEELTVGELVQLRPGGAASDEGWTVTGEASTVSVNGSSILLNLMQQRGAAAVRADAPRLVPQANLKLEP
jgi:hypothetical protein